jgi:hypothetical protein
MKIVKATFCLLAATALGAAVLPSGRADESNKKTVVTFSQAMEVPGKVLPAGTYLFQPMDSPTDRHIVQISNADGTQIITTVLAINDYRLQPAGQMVVKFSAGSGDSPDALRAWFAPGDTFGQEFVYPKARALQLAQAMNMTVPAVAADTLDDSAIKTVAIVAVTPDQKEVDVATAIQTAPPTTATTAAPVAQTTAPVTATSTEPVVQTTAPVAATTPEPVVQIATPVAATSTEPVAETTAPVAATTPEPVAQTATPVAATSTEPVAETTTPVAATTPEPVAQVTSPAAAVTPAPVLASKDTEELPQTASSMPLIAMLGALSIGLALGLKLLLKFAA